MIYAISKLKDHLHLRYVKCAVVEACVLCTNQSAPAGADYEDLKNS